jgi:hypothetical protein
VQTLQWLTLAIGVLLQVLLISALLKGAYRQYPVLLGYAVMDLLNSVVVATAYFDIGKWTKANSKFYWIGEAIQYVLVFILLLHLLSKVLQKQNKGKLIHFLAGGMLYAALSVWMAYDANENLWMTQILRNINFGSIFLNLTLWTLLLRKADRQMLMVAAAFGVQFAGVAIGHSLRQLARELVIVGNLVITISYFVCLFTLYKAMLPARRSETGVTRPPEPTGPESKPDEFPEEVQRTLPV